MNVKYTAGTGLFKYSLSIIVGHLSFRDILPPGKDNKKNVTYL